MKDLGFDNLESNSFYHLQDCLILLNDDSTTLFEAGIVTGDNLLMEMRQVSGWPELVLQQQQISTGIHFIDSE